MSHSRRARPHDFTRSPGLVPEEKEILKFLSDHYTSSKDANAIHSNKIAKGLGKQSKKDINKHLYSLQKKGLVQKVTESPPTWCLLKYEPALRVHTLPINSSSNGPYQPGTHQVQSLRQKTGVQQQSQPSTDPSNVVGHGFQSTYGTRAFDAAETGLKEPYGEHTHDNRLPQTSVKPPHSDDFAIPRTPQDLLNDATSVFHEISLKDKTSMQDELEEQILRVVNNTNQIVLEDIVEKIPDYEINAINEALRSLLAKNSIKKIGRYYSLLHSSGFEAQETVFEGGCGDSMNDYTADVFETSSFFMSVPYDAAPSAPQPSTSQPYALPAPSPPQEAPLQVTHLPEGKNAISVLNEFAQSKQWRINYKENMSGPDHKRRFWMTVDIGGRRFAGPEALTKKDAKLKAAETALLTLTNSKAIELPAVAGATYAIGASKEATLHDKVASLVNQKYNELAQKLPDTITGRKIIAGFVMTRKFKSGQETMEVVSIGSGNRCVMGDKLSLQGLTVNDCHAEVISRRGLMRFFYRELQKLPDGNSIFTSSGDKCKLISGIEFHLYISTAPCGDGAIFAPSDATTDQQDQNDKDGQHHPLFENKKQGLLRTKIENGEGCIPIEEDTAAPTWDGILRGERLRTMSCSDKIAKWNFLGLQGSLLSHFLHPIYMSTLTLGMLYNHGHLTRAICCRVQKSLDTMDGSLIPPNNYKLHHPVVSGQNQNRETGKMKTREYSLNWCLGDVKPEVLDGTEGKCEQRFGSINPPRICKAEIFKEFKKLCDKYGQTMLYQEGYYKSKISAEEYLAAKSVLRDALEHNGFGKWMPKPKEEKDF